MACCDISTAPSQLKELSVGSHTFSVLKNIVGSVKMVQGYPPTGRHLETLDLSILVVPLLSPGLHRATREDTPKTLVMKDSHSCPNELVQARWEETTKLLNEQGKVST